MQAALAYKEFEQQGYHWRCDLHRADSVVFAHHAHPGFYITP
jgi:hypothetical protein